jgi:hypothetical protein
MNDIPTMLERRQFHVKTVRERVYRAPTPRKRERWHALWLLARGGLPPKWPMRWNGTPIRPVIRWKTSASTARRDWPLSKPVVTIDQLSM